MSLAPSVSRLAKRSVTDVPFDFGSDWRACPPQRMRDGFRATMSEHVQREYHTTVAEDGTIKVPASFVASQGLQGGMRVAVRVTEASVSDRLRRRGVTEQEVDEIADRQLESREHVVTFLDAEGAVRSGSVTDKRWKKWLASWK